MVQSEICLYKSYAPTADEGMELGRSFRHRKRRQWKIRHKYWKRRLGKVKAKALKKVSRNHL